MVFILDEGGVFDAPLEKIWKLSRSKFHIHSSTKNMKIERTADPSTIFMTWDSETAGLAFKNRAKLTFLPPIGFTMDYVEGSFAGSREFEYYIPMGDKTGITCVGDWRWAPGGLSDEELRDVVSKFYDEGFREDKENLLRMG